MIVYDHKLSLPPELMASVQGAEGFSGCIEVQIKNNDHDLHALDYGLAFHQNQYRQIQLRSDVAWGEKAPGQRWAFIIEDVASFFWRSGQACINCIPHKLWTPELGHYWLLHTVLPLYFTIEETFCFFHAGAVEIDHQAVLFTAASNGGKSTLTDFFLKQGHALVADDKVAVREQTGTICAAPAYPYNRPYRNVEDLGYPVWHFARLSMPIRAIYQLQRVSPNAKINIRSLQGMEKFTVLGYASEMELPFLKRQRFAWLSRVVARMPVYEIEIPQNLARLPEVHEAILSQLQPHVPAANAISGRPEPGWLGGGLLKSLFAG